MLPSATLNASSHFPLLPGVVPLLPPATTHSALPYGVPGCLPNMFSLPAAVPLTAPPLAAPTSVAVPPKPAPAKVTQTVTNAGGVLPLPPPVQQQDSTNKLRQAFLSALQQSDGGSEDNKGGLVRPPLLQLSTPRAVMEYGNNHHQLQIRWITEVWEAVSRHHHQSFRQLPSRRLRDCNNWLESTKRPTANSPDFLSGFDKAVNREPTTSKELVSNKNDAYSPPFTSRSFDDFHRLLGKDLTPLGEVAPSAAASEPGTTGNLTKPDVHQQSNDKPAIVVPDTTALFTAESYALFAQESALAASQHDAYLPQQHGCNNNNNHSDLDWMVKLVSAHVSQDQNGAAPRKENNASMSAGPGATTSLKPAYLHCVSDPSGSERSGAATETEMSSVRGSTSEGGETSTGSDHTSNESEGSNSDSEECSSRKRKGEWNDTGSGGPVPNDRETDGLVLVGNRARKKSRPPEN